MSDEKNGFQPGGELRETRSGKPPAKSWMLPLIALLVSECLFLVMKIEGLRFHGPVVPVTLGLIKDIADVAIVVLFPWHGWIFTIPLLVIFIVGSEVKILASTLVLSSVLTAAISTIFEFGNPSLQKFTVGVFTYSVINCFVFLLLFSLKMATKGVVKCLR